MNIFIFVKCIKDWFYFRIGLLRLQSISSFSGPGKSGKTGETFHSGEPVPGTGSTGTIRIAAPLSL